MESVNNNLMRFVPMRDVAGILGTDAQNMSELIRDSDMSPQDRAAFADFVLSHKESQS